MIFGKKKEDIPINDIKLDSAEYEADNVEASFEEIQAAMRLGLIATHSVTSTYQAGKTSIRTYTFQVYEEALVKMLDAEKQGKKARTDDGV